MLNVRQTPSSHSIVLNSNVCCVKLRIDGDGLAVAEHQRMGVHRWICLDRTGVEMRERRSNHALDADLLVPLLAAPARARPLVKRDAGRGSSLLRAQDVALLVDRRLGVQRRHAFRRGKRHVRPDLVARLAGVLAQLRRPVRTEASRELAHDRKINSPGQTE